MKNWIITPQVKDVDGKKLYSLEINIPDMQPRPCITFQCEDKTHLVELDEALNRCSGVTWSTNDS
jgi:hypothetical protein